MTCVHMDAKKRWLRCKFDTLLQSVLKRWKFSALSDAHLCATFQSFLLNWLQNFIDKENIASHETTVHQYISSQSLVKYAPDFTPIVQFRSNRIKFSVSRNTLATKSNTIYGAHRIDFDFPSYFRFFLVSHLVIWFFEKHFFLYIPFPKKRVTPSTSSPLWQLPLPAFRIDCG